MEKSNNNERKTTNNESNNDKIHNLSEALKHFQECFPDSIYQGTEQRRGLNWYGVFKYGYTKERVAFVFFHRDPLYKFKWMFDGRTKEFGLGASCENILVLKAEALGADLVSVWPDGKILRISPAFIKDFKDKYDTEYVYTQRPAPGIFIKRNEWCYPLDMNQTLFDPETQVTAQTIGSNKTVQTKLF